MNDAKIEKMANEAVNKIRKQARSKFIGKTGQCAVTMAKELIGEILEGDDLAYFWNLIGAELSYVKVGKMKY